MNDLKKQTQVNGDMIVGSSVAKDWKGADMIDIWNALEIDIAVLGNHGKKI